MTPKRFSQETVVGAYLQEPFAHKASVRKLYQDIFHPEYRQAIQEAWELAKKNYKKASRKA